MGLEPFREEDAGFFCGRDKAIAELTAKVREQWGHTDSSVAMRLMTKSSPP
jgi:hypothetical protein